MFYNKLIVSMLNSPDFQVGELCNTLITGALAQMKICDFQNQPNY